MLSVIQIVINYGSVIKYIFQIFLVYSQVGSFSPEFDILRNLIDMYRVRRKILLCTLYISTLSPVMAHGDKRETFTFTGDRLWVRFPLKKMSRQTAALSSATQHAISPEIDGKRGAECLTIVKLKNITIYNTDCSLKTLNIDPNAMRIMAIFKIRYKILK